MKLTKGHSVNNILNLGTLRVEGKPKREISFAGGSPVKVVGLGIRDL